MSFTISVPSKANAKLELLYMVQYMNITDCTAWCGNTVTAHYIAWCGNTAIAHFTHPCLMQINLGSSFAKQSSMNWVEKERVI